MVNDSPRKKKGHFRRILEAPLYSAGISAYRLGVGVASLWNPKAKKLMAGHREIASRLKAGLDGDRVIWIHAASLGEFEQGRPLIEKIRRELPDRKILLTFFSPSGYEVRKNFKDADCVCYLPFDTPRRVRRFLDTVRPEIAIFVKYEFWRNYLEQLHRRSIPTYLISATFRPEQHFFRYRHSWYAEWLRWYSHIFLQDERSRQLLAGIGLVNTDVFGDTRFDRVADIRANRTRIPALESFRALAPDSPVMMAGSSWPADEDIYAAWFNRNPDTRLVIAPHEFDTKRLGALKARFKNGCLLLSEVTENPELLAAVRPQVLVIDCFGLLSSAYAYCDVAYVGGGFGAGLHNINEAAVYDVPVIYGPNNRKFIEAREMAECGGGIEITSPEEFNAVADRLLGKDADESERAQRGKSAGEYIRSKLGATDKIFKSIFS